MTKWVSILKVGDSESFKFARGEGFEEKLCSKLNWSSQIVTGIQGALGRGGGSKNFSIVLWEA